MPKKPAHDPTYGYDHDTRTVRVGHHDLARLLLMFRSLMLHQKPGSWDHMRDYDLSFERLADAVDAGSQIRYGKRWQGPDLRMRCTTTEPVYDWPEGAPYDAEATFTWNVPGYGSHASEDDQAEPYSNTALCGFSWAKGDRPRRVDGLPDCPECRREVQLGAELPRGSW
ncbi:hypothetical protein [Streptomyces europaeiscabiei]|uniref:hypothetical protein n=1 Tax=Streptomyces europaeiscabiei TaxID=146819 RepID=UPI000B285E8B|nr:hypothetical protein [Streptomyces europaeiscabiei]MDX3673408.1 hypothetical protein [Streptomyces europaeiscabiei]MDX3716329.1 hypothetical protein [Streptomyces europaeiscabiei]